jgi:hypothetical protein
MKQRAFPRGASATLVDGNSVALAGCTGGSGGDSGRDGRSNSGSSDHPDYPQNDVRMMLPDSSASGDDADSRLAAKYLPDHLPTDVDVEDQILRRTISRMLTDRGTNR